MFLFISYVSELDIGHVQFQIDFQAYASNNDPGRFIKTIESQLIENRTHTYTHLETTMIHFVEYQLTSGIVPKIMPPHSLLHLPHLSINSPAFVIYCLWCENEKDFHFS